MLSHVKILQSCEDGGLHVSQILMPMAIMANNSFGMKLSLLPNCHRLAWPIGIHIVDTKTEVRTRHTRIRHGSCCADSLHVVSHHRTAQKAKKSRMPMDHLRWSAILYYWVFVDVSRRDGWVDCSSAKEDTPSALRSEKVCISSTSTCTALQVGPGVVSCQCQRIYLDCPPPHLLQQRGRKLRFCQRLWRILLVFRVPNISHNEFKMTNGLIGAPWSLHIFEVALRT